MSEQKSKEADAAVQDENKLIAQRREKLKRLRDQGNPFPNDFRRDAYAGDLHRAYGDKEQEELEKNPAIVKVAGRIVRIRGPFMVIQDMTGRIQLYFSFKEMEPEHKAEIKSWDLGDIVGAEGEVFRTNKGDLAIRAGLVRLLTKSLRPLPDKHKGLADTETRYRQRYLDLIVNEDVRETFIVRSRIIDAIRHYLNGERFIEVETPMMHVIPGGAVARPFVTHHHSLDQEMYLRIAPELYLKRLIVGGFEKVYEINRSFRNEGLSTRHNPEFTMLEFYQAYADYHDLMDLTEKMLRTITKEVLGTSRINHNGAVIDLEQPFLRMTLLEAILTHVTDIAEEDIASVDKARQTAEKLDVAIKPEWGAGKIQLEIFEQKVEHLLQQPTFIIEYPTEVSPLARRNDSNPDVADRFELFIGGREIANAFSELNDAEDQAERFRAQAAEKDAGDHEAMHYDSDYITALEYGMPPTAGEGIGIDRLVMLFTDSHSIRDVLLFPHMRPQRD